MSEVLELTEEKVPTLQDHVNLLQGLHTCLDLPGVRFAQLITENIEKLSAEVQPVEDLVQPTPEFQKFVQECHAFAGKDEAKRKEFEGMHPAVVKARDEQMEMVNNMLAEPLELKLKKIPKAVLPPQMTGRQYMAIQSIIY